MLKLFLLRHAKSSWDDPGLDDFSRPLAPRGNRAATRMRDYIRSHGMVRPGLVLCSSAVRARQTYELVSAALRDVPVRYDDMLYTFESIVLLNYLRGLSSVPNSVMVVGHSPALPELSLELLSPKVNKKDKNFKRLANRFPTGALVGLTVSVEKWGDLVLGSCVLDLFVRPKDLDEK